jgi:tetratricopeptide (TPR) repeat protein
MIRKFIFPALLLALTALWPPAGGFAGEENLGALFLDEPVGARATAMGEAMTAVCDDANAVFWNPAGLSRYGRRELLLAHAQSYQGFRNEYAALALPWSRTDALGVNVFFDYADGFEKFSAAGDPDGSFGLYDLYAGVTWSHVFSNRLSASLSLKGLHQVIDTYSASSFAADLGFLWYQALPNLNLGATLRNLGMPVVFIADRHPLNLTLEAGAAYTVWDKTLLLACGVRKPLAQELTLKFGAEYNLFNLDLAFLRAGYRMPQSGNALGAIAGLTLGLGLRVADYDLDYAYTPFPDLGDAHRLTLTLPLGRSIAEEQQMLEKLEKQVKAKQLLIFQQTVAEGDRWLAANDLDKAAAAYTRAFSLNPNDASLKEKLNRLDTSRRKQSADKHAARGRKAMQDKDYLTALVEWSKVLELLPEDAEAQRMVSAANQKLSSEKLSAETNKNRQLIDQYYQQGLQALQSGRYSQALELWKKILELDNGNARVAQYMKLTQSKIDDLADDLLRLADEDWDSGQYLNAVKKWRQVLDIAGKQSAAAGKLELNRAKLDELADQYYRQGVEQYVQNNLDAAVTTWQSVLVFQPGNAKALEHLEQVKKKRKELQALE